MPDTPDGSTPDRRWLNVRLSAIEDARDHDVGRLLVLRDVSERRRMVETIRRLSLTDELTGLLNRRGFTTLAEQQLRTSARTGQRLWLLFADVDGLKDINDRFGHETGDQALRDIARLLGSGLFRAADIVARFGGDEFAILATETGPTDGRELTQRIEIAFDEANADPGRAFSLSVSVGSAVFDPSRPASLDELTREADRRMYEAKRTRRTAREQPDAVGEVRVSGSADRSR